MKISLSWLKEHLNTTWSVQQICDGLIQLGHELDGVEDESAKFNNVVIGKVLERTQHPDADKLGVCKVELGEQNDNGQPRTIVCGAPNVRAGLSVAVALPGAVLPGDFAIKQSKIRGVTSDGMICSERELNLGEDHDGIWEIDTTAAAGTPLAQAMGWDDVILDVAVTPNRGDCLSVRGLARDLAALGAGELLPLPKLTQGTGTPSRSVELTTQDCPAFSLIELTNVQNGPSPQWLQQRLEQAGLRPRSIVVDVTNYIMLTYGQPLHAYDAAKVKGNFGVRAAKAGEEFTGIGDVELKLNEGDIVITDDSGIIGLGGILGGTNTAVSQSTTTVLLEAAWFTRSRIARTGQAHTVQTDARYRFERGIDPAFTALANQHAANLLQTYANATFTATATTGNFSKPTANIPYSAAFCRTFGGLDITEDQQKQILNKLGFDIEIKDKSWTLTAPTWRTYMQNPEDVVEELLRVVGYNAVPAQLPEIPTFSPIPQAPELALTTTARRTFVGAGYLETLTYSFIKQQHAKAFTQENCAELDNPLDADLMTTMRPSLWPGLLAAAQYNLARQQPLTHLCELGTIFLPEAEEQHAAGLLLPAQSRHWQGKAQANDVFAAKAMALNILKACGVNESSLQVTTSATLGLHPGQCGQWVQGKTVLAQFGTLHPTLAKQFDLPQSTSLFNVNLTAVAACKRRQKAFSISPYPSVERDLAFVLDQSITAQDVERTIKNIDKSLIQTVTVFDVYQGKGVEEGKKSLALSLTLQSPDRTLEDAEIKQIMDKAIQAVAQRHNGQLRG